MQCSMEKLVCELAGIPHPRNPKGLRKPTKRTPILLLLSLWFSLASGAFAATEVAYVDGTGHQRIYAFATGSDSHLKVNYWDGFAWHWADQGLPAGTSAVYTPTAITYVSGGKQRIYVFAQASNYHLVVNYWDGSAWHWADQGVPPGSNGELFQPTAITYVSGGKQRIYVFGTSGNHHLVVNYWDGDAWHWADQGAGPGTGIENPTAITYLSGVQQRIYVFAQALNFDLVVNYWDGSAWHWANQGLPAGAELVAEPSAITYESGGSQRIYVFCTANGGLGFVGHLVVNYWDGSTWHWADQGPGPGNGMVEPSAITYLSGGHQRIYVYAQGLDDDLVVNYWNGATWNWEDLRRPAGAGNVGYPSAITFPGSSGTQLTYVFSEAFFSGANDYQLIVNYGDGAHWYWADQGTL